MCDSEANHSFGLLVSLTRAFQKRGRVVEQAAQHQSRPGEDRPTEENLLAGRRPCYRQTTVT